MSAEWTPSKSDYLKLERAIIDLMYKTHKQGGQIEGLAILVVLASGTIVLHIVLGWMGF